MAEPMPARRGDIASAEMPGWFVGIPDESPAAFSASIDRAKVMI
jgi:hypothetical protein